MRSFLLGGACAASMMLALVPVASAADVDLGPEPAGWGWYLSVFGGWSGGQGDLFDFSETVGSSPAYSVTAEADLDNGFMAGAAIGARFNEWLRGEVEVSGHWHDVEGSATIALTSAPLSAAYYDLDGSADALFVLANLWFDIPVGDVLRPYVGGGIGFGRLDVDLHATNTTAPTTGFVAVDDSDWGFAYQVGAGIGFGLAPNAEIDIGYRFKAINNLELETEPSSGSIGFDADYRSHNVLVGLRVGF